MGSPRVARRFQADRGSAWVASASVRPGAQAREHLGREQPDEPSRARRQLAPALELEVDACQRRRRELRLAACELGDQERERGLVADEEDALGLATRGGELGDELAALARVELAAQLELRGESTALPGELGGLAGARRARAQDQVGGFFQAREGLADELGRLASLRTEDALVVA